MQTTKPLYRQSVMLERETGIELSRATLDGWVMRVGELLRPVSAAMAQELLAETISRPMKRRWEFNPKETRQNHQAYLWQCSRPGGVVAFDFRMGRETGRSQTVPGQLRRRTPE